MRKSISITNNIIIGNLANSINFSEVVEVALLYYLGEVTKEYVETYKALQDATASMKSRRKRV